MIFIVIAIMAVIFLILWACIDIVPQAEARVIERLGMFHSVWNAGIHVKIPIIDKAVVPHIDLREQVLELPKSNSIGSGVHGDFDAYAKGLGSTYYKKSFDRSSFNANIDGLASGTANMIGQFTSVLGEAGINISDMINKSRDDMAYTIINTDHSVTDEVVEKLNAIDGVLRVRAIR
jgi:hypothetical protein